MAFRRVSLVVASVMLLAGCGGSTDDGPSGEEGVEQVQDEMLGAVDGVLHEVAATTGIEFKSGNRWAVVCGDSIDPIGVTQRASLHFGPPPESTVEQAVDDATAALEDAGWSVERPANPAVVVAESGRLTLDLRFGGAGTEASLRASCVDTSDDVAKEYQDKKFVDLEWK